MERPPSRDSGTPPSWVMRSNEFIDTTVFTIGLSLVWLALSALGLFVLGLAPATCAAADVMAARRRDDEPRLFHDMWNGYRHGFVRANTRLLPFIAVQAAAALSVVTAVRSVQDAGAVSAVMATIALLAAAWATVSAMVVVAGERVRRQDWPVSMRLAVLMPGALPAPSIAALLAVGLWSALSMILPPVGALLGPAIAARIAVAVLGERISDLLAAVDAERRDSTQTSH